MRRRKAKKTPLLTLILLFAVTCLLLIPRGGGDGTSIVEDVEYYNETEVAAYINEFHHLPDNYVTKSEAQELGWQGGNPMDSIGKCIGGNRYGNYEGLLPEGEYYYECDVNYAGDDRGPERLVYTKSGKVYYTKDHYESFEQLY